MDLNIDIFSAFNDDWALLTAGTPEHFNTMAISWGTLGTLWSKPVATVFVKPVRYTHDFMESSEFFTVCFFDRSHRREIAYLGSRSGRDGDKLAATSLTAVPVGESVGFAQAHTTLLCRKLYTHDLDIDRIPAEIVAQDYTEEAPHTVYVGEVISVTAP